MTIEIVATYHTARGVAVGSVTRIRRRHWKGTIALDDAEVSRVSLAGFRTRRAAVRWVKANLPYYAIREGR